MKCDVLVYGFGVTGKHVLGICKELRLTYKIVDDFALPFGSDFVSLEDIKVARLILICLNDEDAQENAKNKLLQLDFDLNVIKVINLGDFRNSYLESFKDRFSAISFIDTLLEDDYKLNNFQQIYKEIIKEYKEKKIKEVESKKELLKKVEDKYPELNSFARIFTTSFKQSDNDLLHYPYFHVFTDRSCSDKNFFFREEVDFHSLKNRDINTKFVLCFGSSVMRADEVALESTIAKRLEGLLNSPAGGGGIPLLAIKY